MNKKPNHVVHGGFTLIEIMVVLAIVAVMVATISYSFSRDADRIARLEAERFHLIVNEARDEAVISGFELTLSVEPKKGQYWLETQVNSTRNMQALLKKRNVGEFVNLSWDVLSAFEEEQQRDRKTVLITPLGEITPFEAKFKGDEYAFIVYIDDTNQLQRREQNSAAL